MVGGGGEIWGERDTLSPPDKSPEAICASHSFLSLTFQPQIFQVNPGILGPPPRQQAPGRPPEALKECSSADTVSHSSRAGAFLS